MFVPWNVNHDAQVVLEREIEKPFRGNVVNSQDIRAQFSQQLKIVQRLFERGKKFALRIGRKRPVGYTFNIKLFLSQSEELAIDLNSRFVLSRSTHGVKTSTTLPTAN